MLLGFCLFQPKSVVLRCCRVIQVSGSFGAFGSEICRKVGIA